jgi:hypothetical protein
MNLSARLSLIIIAVLQLALITSAAPAYSFERLLPRAETIFLGRTISRSDDGVTFQVAEVLRGRIEGHEPTFGYHLHAVNSWPSDTSLFLVISQGDNHFGQPKQVISLGQPLKGQAGYCGWIAFPMKGDGNQLYLDRVQSFMTQKPTTNPGRLTLEEARMFIEKFLYRPNLHGGGV